MVGWFGEARRPSDELAVGGAPGRRQRCPPLDERAALPDRLKAGPFQPPAQSRRAQHPADLRVPLAGGRHEPPHQPGVAGEEVPDGDVHLFHGHQPARPHHAPELAQGRRQLVVGEVLRHIGAPDRVEMVVREREGRQAPDLRGDRAGERPAAEPRAYGGDVLRREVERGDPAGRADFRGDEGDEAATAAPGVEDMPSPLEADRAEHRLVLRSRRREMHVEPLGFRQRVPLRRGVEILRVAPQAAHRRTPAVASGHDKRDSLLPIWR
jgi:hypothetical protein